MLNLRGNSSPNKKAETPSGASAFAFSLQA